MNRHPVFIAFLAVLLAVMLAGSSHGPAGLHALAATPMTPTVLRIPVASDPKSFEPALTAELVSLWIAENLHAGLVRYDFRGKVEPYLAEKYQISPDGRIYTFTLRQGIKWQNGRPIVASDFKKGWERYLDPKIPAQLAPDYLGGIRGARDVIAGRTRDLGGVQAPDDRTLKVALVSADPSFLLRLASAVTWVVPEEAVVAGKPEWKDKPVGAGPFKFVEWRRNEKIVLEAWDGFFLGRPTVDRIEYRVVPDRATSLAQYEAGELDLVEVAGSDLRRITGDPVLSKQLHYWTGARLQYFGLNMYKMDVFKDKRVRQAFNYALNKQEIVDRVLFNAVKPATGLVPQGIPEYNPKLKGYEYNPERAQQLLAEAGFPGGRGFPAFQVSSDGRSTTVLEAFAAQIRQNLGVNVEVNVVERGQMVKGLWDHKTWSAFFWGWTADFPSAEIWTHQLLHGGLDSNFFGYNNPEFDKIVDQARATLDESKRKALWQRAEQIAMDDAAMIPFSYFQYIYLVKPSVKGVLFRFDGPYWFKNITIQK